MWLELKRTRQLVMGNLPLAMRQLGRTLAQVADTRNLITEVQLTLFKAHMSGNWSPLADRLNASIEGLRNSIRAYRD